MRGERNQERHLIFNCQSMGAIMFSVIHLCTHSMSLHYSSFKGQPEHATLDTEPVVLHERTHWDGATLPWSMSRSNSTILKHNLKGKGYESLSNIWSC